MDFTTVLLLFSFAVIAFLYSSIGHGGASGYLAIMALAGIAPAMMKSSALIMNLSVSLISFYGFYKAGHFRIKLFIPFIISSVPMAYLGGTMSITDLLYKKILAICLLLSVARLVFQFKTPSKNKEMPFYWGLISGAIIGLISGMIGIGGGILLSPLILFMGWADIKQTAAISAPFIFVNSLAGLLGNLKTGNFQLSEQLNYAIMATIAGAIAGAYYGSNKLNLLTLKYFLAIGLSLASIKLLFT